MPARASTGSATRLRQAQPPGFDRLSQRAVCECGQRGSHPSIVTLSAAKSLGTISVEILRLRCAPAQDDTKRGASTGSATRLRQAQPPAIPCPELVEGQLGVDGYVQKLPIVFLPQIFFSTKIILCHICTSLNALMEVSIQAALGILKSVCGSIRLGLGLFIQRTGCLSNWSILRNVTESTMLLIEKNKFKGGADGKS